MPPPPLPLPPPRPPPPTGDFFFSSTLLLFMSSFSAPLTAHFLQLPCRLMRFILRLKMHLRERQGEKNFFSSSHSLRLCVSCQVAEIQLHRDSFDKRQPRGALSLSLSLSLSLLPISISSPGYTHHLMPLPLR